MTNNMMIAAKKTRWFRSSYRNTCIRSMEKENDEYLKTIKLKVTKCKMTQNYKSSFTVVFFSTIQLHHKFITSHTKTKNEIQTRFSKWCENEKQKAKFKSVFQSHAKTKRKWRWSLNSIFLCHRKTVGTKVHAFVRSYLGRHTQIFG